MKESVTSKTIPKLTFVDSSGPSSLPPYITDTGLVGDNVPFWNRTPSLPATVEILEIFACPGVGALKPVLVVNLKLTLSVALKRPDNLKLLVDPKVSKSS